ncbi:MAG: DUF1194 domain-containing protein [Pseudomonadota bacterium]|nr:DUF1194 domain-containing protein [Pseudomonadota bacterium]
MSEAVDLALVLAIDTSGSVSDGRLALQRRGYEAAFRDPALLHAVAAGPRGRIAATFVEWSDAGRQVQAVGWTLIAGVATARGFADAIGHALSPTPGWTSISGAIDYSAALLRRSGVNADRQVIDVSGDGSNNDGRPVAAARDEAVTAGITINGLPIVEIDPTLDAYYRQHVIGGPNAFVVVARDAASFANAVLRKLLVEVAGARPGALSRASGEPR